MWHTLCPIYDPYKNTQTLFAPGKQRQLCIHNIGESNYVTHPLAYIRCIGYVSPIHLMSAHLDMRHTAHLMAEQYVCPAIRWAACLISRCALISPSYGRAVCLTSRCALWAVWHTLYVLYRAVYIRCIGYDRNILTNKAYMCNYVTYTLPYIRSIQKHTHSFFVII